MTAKPRLGRGLDALIGGDDAPATTPDTPRVALDRIRQNPHQPRKAFDEDDLDKLSASIREHGVLQPLVVRVEGDAFQLIAGERRLRAARRAGLERVPVHLVDFNDQQVFEAALAENVQRADLNAIEKAQGFRDYLDRFGQTHEQLAERLGLDRTTISNLLGLLHLCPEVQDFVRVGQLSQGHAKALKGIAESDRQVALAKEAIARSLSVHALEQLAKENREAAAVAGGGEAVAKAAAEKTAHVQAIEDELRQRLATRVTIKLKAKDKGQVVIGFDSTDDFERIVETFRKAA
jgi:ParB family transcriptional regulator, chromosome partitioning protein